MMLAVVEPMVRFTLLANSQVSQTSRRVQVTSRLATWARSPFNHCLRPRHASLQEQTPYNNSVSLCGSGECCTIVSSEFLDAFARKIVLNIKRFPPLLQVKLLVRNRFTGSLVLELVVGRWEILARPLFQDFSGHGCKLGLESKQ